jgi:N-acetylglutamate synthase
MGIKKCHLMVRQDNAPARAFWSRLRWNARDDITLMSHGDPEAIDA